MMMLTLWGLFCIDNDTRLGFFILYFPTKKPTFAFQIDSVNYATLSQIRTVSLQKTYDSLRKNRLSHNPPTKQYCCPKAKKRID